MNIPKFHNAGWYDNQARLLQSFSDKSINIAFPFLYATTREFVIIIFLTMNHGYQIISDDYASGRITNNNRICASAL